MALDILINFGSDNGFTSTNANLLEIWITNIFIKKN